MGSNDLAVSLGFNTGGSETAVKISSIAMVVTVIFLFLVAIFLFLFYLYAHFYLGPRAAARRRAQFIFSAPDAPISTCCLDAAILRSLPVTVYKPSEFKEGLECTVCLSELSEGEEARLLPKCNHGFHLQCIDMWLYSHSTCPLCRSPVGMEASAVAAETPLAESSDLPTNVLLWAYQDQFSAERLASQSERSSERMLVISIPARSTEDIFAASASPLPSSRSQMEEMKSPAETRSPATSKLGSLKRLFSMGKKIAGSSSSSPGVCDIEQGLVGYAAAKAEGSSVLLKSPITSLQVTCRGI